MSGSSSYPMNPYSSFGAGSIYAGNANQAQMGANPMTAVPQYVSGPTTTGAAPAMTSAQITSQGVLAEQQLPQELRVTNDNEFLSPEARARYEQMYYNQYINPTIAQTRSDLYGQGRADSSFGGAVLGQQIAQGDYEKLMAGEQLYQNRLNQVIQRRGAMEPSMQRAQAANLTDIQTAYQNANLAAQNAQNQNAFNQSNYQTYGNNYWKQQDLNYNNTWKQQELDQRRNENRWNNYGNLGYGLSGAAGGFLGL